MNVSSKSVHHLHVQPWPKVHLYMCLGASIYYSKSIIMDNEYGIILLEVTTHVL